MQGQKDARLQARHGRQMTSFLTQVYCQLMNDLGVYRGASASRLAMRSFALRARGLPAISSSDGNTGFLGFHSSLGR